MNKCLESISKNVDDEIVRAIGHQYILAGKTYNNLNLGDIKSSIYYQNARQHLLTLCVYTSLDQISQDANFPIYSDDKIVNNFQRRNPLICLQDCILTTTKTSSEDKLPRRKYMLELSKNNGNNDMQLSFNYNDYSICQPPYYAIITYDYDYILEKYKYINILIPDAQCNAILKKIPVYSHKVNNDIIHTSYDEEELIRLTESVKDKIKNISNK